MADPVDAEADDAAREGVILPEPDAPDEPFVHRGRPEDPQLHELRHTPNPVVRVLRMVGPGLITGAADDDPTGIGTYAQAGAQTGFGMLWLMPLLLPFMVAVQWMCARIALVTGRGLAGTLRRHYPRPVVVSMVAVLVVINVVTAGADIGAMASAAALYLPVPLPALILAATALILALQFGMRYSTLSSILGWLAFANLIYLAAAVLARPDPLAVLRGAVVPNVAFDAAWVGIAVAVVGTTINPYLFFWQASEEVEEQVAKGRHRLWQRQGATDAELAYRAWDVGFGMAFSQLIGFSVVVTTGATLFVAGIRNVGSLTDIAQALARVAGPAAEALFVVGIVGTGILAVPVLTGGAAHALGELLGHPVGLAAHPSRAPLFYGVIAASTLAAAAFNLLGVNVVQALVAASLLAGLQTPPMIVLLMLIANDRTIMGDRTNGRLMNALGWGMAALMTLAVVGLAVSALARR